MSVIRRSKVSQIVAPKPVKPLGVADTLAAEKIKKLDERDRRRRRDGSGWAGHCDAEMKIDNRMVKLRDRELRAQLRRMEEREFRGPF